MQAKRPSYRDVFLPDASKNECFSPARFFVPRCIAGQGGITFPFPHLIWYEFKTAFLPGRVSFRPGQNNNHCGNTGYWCGATKWQFIGTNDADCNRYSNWTILCEDLSGKPFKFVTHSKYCTVRASLRKSFQCLGISVLETNYPHSPNVTLGGVKMWRQVVQ